MLAYVVCWFHAADTHSLQGIERKPSLLSLETGQDAPVFQAGEEWPYLILGQGMGASLPIDTIAQ